MKRKFLSTREAITKSREAITKSYRREPTEGRENRVDWQVCVASMRRAVWVVFYEPTFAESFQKRHSLCAICGQYCLEPGHEQNIVNREKLVSI
jgi:hypothetical protein